MVVGEVEEVVEGGGRIGEKERSTGRVAAVNQAAHEVLS